MFKEIDGLGIEFTTASGDALIPIKQNGVTGRIKRENLLVADVIAVDYPTSFSHWHDESKALVGGAVVPDYSSTYPYGVTTYQASPAINNSFEFNKLLASGEYIFNILYQKGTNRGDLKLEINGEQAFDDLIGYQGSFSFLTTTRTINIPNNGLQNFKFTVFQKQAASSNYVFGIVKMWAFKI